MRLLPDNIDDDNDDDGDDDDGGWRDLRGDRIYEYLSKIFARRISIQHFIWEKLPKLLRLE
jgi:hypothetical protein